MAETRWGQCPEVSPAGERCRLQHGHGGPHQAAPSPSISRSTETAKSTWVGAPCMRRLAYVPWTSTLGPVHFLFTSVLRPFTHAHACSPPDPAPVPLPQHDRPSRGADRPTRTSFRGSVGSHVQGLRDHHDTAGQVVARRGARGMARGCGSSGPWGRTVGSRELTT